METKFGELDFNGFLIQLTQSDGFDTMVNATEMAKPFGINKQPAFWLRSKAAKEYIEAFNNYQKNALRNLQSTPLRPVITIEGNYADGTRQGTWMHRWIAIEFARWLDPNFAIWCNQRIDELLKYGFTIALDEERERYNALLESNKPKVEYYDKVLTSSENLYSTEQVCKELGLEISPQELLKKMENNKLIYRRPDGKWFLSKTFDSFGYLRVVTILDKKTGKPRNLRRWTEEGKHWIWSLRGKI